MAEWKGLTQEITNTPDAFRGNTLPSGTPYSLGAILQQQAASLFELMTENKGLYIEDMLRKFIIPHLKTKMDTTDEIVAILDAEGIAEIDAMYVPKAAIKEYHRKAIDLALKGEIIMPFNKSAEEGGIKESMRTLKDRRFFVPSEISTKTWKEVFKDFEWKCTVQVTNEPQDKQALMTTLSTVLQTVASNPMILQNPVAKDILGRILSITGAYSPLNISSGLNDVPPEIQQPSQPMAQTMAQPLPTNVNTNAGASTNY
jgi:hypothetical protein